MPSETDDLEIETWATLLRAQTAVIRQLEDEIQSELGISLVWYEVLLHLGEAPKNRLRLQELTERLLLTQSGVSRLVDRMVAAGLLDRSADDTDRRSRVARLTTKGRRVLRESARVHRRGITEHFSQHLTPDEQRVLRHALAKVQAAAASTDPSLQPRAEEHMSTTTITERSVAEVHDPVVVLDTDLHVAKEAIKPGLWEAHDPFLLMMEDRFGEGAFGMHPHRGLETITYVIDGRLQHSDNRGGGGVLGARDVQLMTAGSGIIHLEAPPADETVHLLQLWLNLPATAKLTEPRYQDLRGAEMPQVDLDGAQVTVYSGSSHGVRSHALNHVPLTLVEIDLEPGATVTQDLPGSYNGFVHVINGRGHVGAERTNVAEGQTVWLEHTETSHPTTITTTAETPMRVLIAAGEPLHEPVVTSGPFVMNTEQQIADAYTDFKAGRFNP